MSNILDYLEWRGDLAFSASPFNDIDGLILCQISYLDFGGILSADFKKTETIGSLWAKFHSAPDFERRCDTGALISRSTVTLLEKAASSVRFSSIKVSGYVSITDFEKEEQFSAMCFFEKKACSEPFVAFRGTDDTIVGWKEDFNMALETMVPAQKDGIEYIEKVAANTRGNIVVGGHSKGGNIAVYASVYSGSKIKKRIERVYNYDGPGFRKDVLESKDFEGIEDMLHSYYPQLSIVGMMFNHAGKSSVVESDGVGIMQHDPFSWHLGPVAFVCVNELDQGSRYFHSTFNDWIESLSKDKRELFVETLFEVISASDARTNSEITANLLKVSPKMLMALHHLDKETREEFLSVIQMFFDSARKNITDMIFKHW